MLQEQLKAAGIELVLNYQEAGALFGEQLPAGDYQLALYAQVLTFITPGQCLLFCSKNIPSADNEMSGQNWQRVDIPELDPVLEELDRTVDDASVAELGAEADAIEAEAQITPPARPAPEHLDLEREDRRARRRQPGPRSVLQHGAVGTGLVRR